MRRIGLDWTDWKERDWKTSGDVPLHVRKQLRDAYDRGVSSGMKEAWKDVCGSVERDAYDKGYTDGQLAAMRAYNCDTTARKEGFAKLVKQKLTEYPDGRRRSIGLKVK